MSGGGNKSYPLSHFKKFKSIIPQSDYVSVINRLTRKGCGEDVFAEGEDVVTCRVTLKRAPKGMAPAGRKA